MRSIRIRPAEPADAEAIARVQAVTWQAAYLGILPHEILAAFGQAQGGAFWSRVLDNAPSESVLIAELEDQILGFVSSGPSREHIPGYDGEFYALYVMPEGQGCGIGKALVAHAARSLVRQRWLGAAVWVLEDNHLGRQFYERLDGQPLGLAKSLAYRGVEYPNIREMAYGWPDLRRAEWLVDEPDRR